MFRCRDEPVNTQSRCVNGSSIRQWIDKSGWQRKMHTETSPLGRVIRSGLIPLNFQRDKSVHSAPFAYIGRERLGCKNGSRPFFCATHSCPTADPHICPKRKRTREINPVSLFVNAPCHHNLARSRTLVHGSAPPLAQVEGSSWVVTAAPTWHGVVLGCERDMFGSHQPPA